MSKVSYDSSVIAPIEAVSIAYNITHNENGDRISVLYDINLRGKLLSNYGSPDPNGTFLEPATECQVIANTGVNDTNWLESLLNKRCAVNNLFKNDYKKLSIGTVSSGSDLTCYPRVVSLSFEESDNPQYWPFTVNLQADNLFCNGSAVETTGGPRLKTFSETWDFSYDDGALTREYGDNRLYNVTHSVSAQGLKTYGSTGNILYSGIDAARQYVASKIGVNATQPTLAISGFQAYTTKYNYVDVHNVDTQAAIYGVNESWIYHTGNYTEEYTIESNTSNSKSCPTVSINGTITGLGERSLTSGTMISSKYDNAKTYWDTLGASGLKSKIVAKLGGTYYDVPTSTSFTAAPIAGTISYNYEFQGGPTKQLPEANWENITVSNTFSEDIYATATILGGGEIIQVVNGGGFYKLYKTSLTIDATYPCSTGIHKLGPRFTPSLSSSIQSVVNSYNPLLSISGVGYQVVDSQNEAWNAYDSSYNLSITWNWQYLGVCS